MTLDGFVPTVGLSASRELSPVITERFLVGSVPEGTLIEKIVVSAGGSLAGPLQVALAMAGAVPSTTDEMQTTLSLLGSSDTGQRGGKFFRMRIQADAYNNAFLFPGIVVGAGALLMVAEVTNGSGAAVMDILIAVALLAPVRPGSARSSLAER